MPDRPPYEKPHISFLAAKARSKKKGPTLAIESGEGVPSISVIRSNWCTTFFPGKRGFPVKTSAKMQPMLHMSIAGVYCNTR